MGGGRHSKGGKCGWSVCAACNECKCWRMGGDSYGAEFSRSYGYSYDAPDRPCEDVGPYEVNSGWTGDGWGAVEDSHRWEKRGFSSGK
jgi:hypothetical protein